MDIGSITVGTAMLVVAVAAAVALMSRMRAIPARVSSRRRRSRRRSEIFGR